MQVPDVLWGEAVHNAVYILNRVTTEALEEATPYQMWTGRKPNIVHLRVFGCIAHAKVKTGHRCKLDDRSKPLVHLGTKIGTKAYRLFDPVT